ncbi:MAG TPA: hypothetical protein DGO89_00055 [Microcoleaceae bacterium UBA9251]|nr:hypothetical protein [Microcoleaceae cyanobacterium UBA9251]
MLYLGVFSFDWQRCLNFRTLYSFYLYESAIFMQNTGFLLQKFTFGRSDFGRYQSWGQLGGDRNAGK